jgi:hypothetical protein
MMATLYPFVNDLIKSGSLAYLDFLRVMAKSESIGAMEPMETSGWHRDSAMQLLAEADVPVGKTVLLSCDNNTQIEFSETFWLEVAALVRNAGLIPCLNASGTSRSNHQPVLLREVDYLKKIVVPPHLAVSVAAACGFYIGGTNGFTGIQCLFNEPAKGLHLINCTESQAGVAKEKGGGENPIYLLHQSYFFRGLGRGRLKEIEVYTNSVPREAADFISQGFEFD